MEVWTQCLASNRSSSGFYRSNSDHTHSLYTTNFKVVLRYLLVEYVYEMLKYLVFEIY